MITMPYDWGGGERMRERVRERIREDERELGVWEDESRRWCDSLQSTCLCLHISYYAFQVGDSSVLMCVF